MKLSIIIPIYNEEATIEELIKKVEKVNLEGIRKELVVVDDFSKDNTSLIVKKVMKKYKNIKLVKHENNKGKGAAIRTALNHISGDMLIIQDGDLEYNPEEYKVLLKPMINGSADVVYGSRLKGKIKGFNIPTHYLGNKLLSLITSLLYSQKVSDMETCYKLMKTKVIRKIKLRATRFDFEPEITAKIIKAGYKIHEVPITYNSRSFKEGKKINWKDGVKAIYYLLKYRFIN